jgi:DNA replication protein DnaC
MLREVVGQLNRMKLAGMGVGLQGWMENPANADGSPLECVETMLAAQQQVRASARVNKFAVKCGLPPRFTLGSFDPRQSGIMPARVATLRTLAWLDLRQNLVIMGPRASGKRHLACALAVEAVRSGRTAHYVDTMVLLHQLDSRRRQGCADELTREMARPALLVLGSMAEESILPPYTTWLRRLVERRAALGRPTVVTSRSPVDEWPEMFEGSDNDALVGRLTEGAHMVKLKPSA